MPSSIRLFGEIPQEWVLVGRRESAGLPESASAAAACALEARVLFRRSPKCKSLRGSYYSRVESY